MKAGTFFSGIDAPEMAAPDFDWRWRAEIDPFANAVSEHHRPGVVNLGNMEKLDFDRIEPVDLIVFGSPCQDFSVAGKRLGLDGPRGNLALVALAALDRIRPRWFVFENVPGLLSNWSGAEESDLEPGQSREAVENSDFAAFLGAVRDCGYLACWRVFDAQFAGVPQRRRRPFLVGYLGDWRPPAAVLFERESLRGDPPPGRETGEDVTGTIASRAGNGGVTDRDIENGNLIAYGGNNTAGPIDTATAVNAHGGPHGRCDFESETFVAHALTGEGFDASEDGTGRGTPIIPMLAVGAGNANSAGIGRNGDPMFALDSTGAQAVANQMVVRRLTPRECERLQGFPDDHTKVPYRGKPASKCPDGPRYKALGNAMAVPVIGWILERLQAVDAITRTTSGDERAA